MKKKQRDALCTRGQSRLKNSTKKNFNPQMFRTTDGLSNRLYVPFHIVVKMCVRACAHIIFRASYISIYVP